MKKYLIIVFILGTNSLLFCQNNELNSKSEIKSITSKTSNFDSLKSTFVMANCTFIQNENFKTIFLKLDYDVRSDTLCLIGNIFDAKDSAAIFGATIICLNSYIGTVSDVNGEYYLKFKYSDIDSISFSYIGYNKQIISIVDKINEILTKDKAR